MKKTRFRLHGYGSDAFDDEPDAGFSVGSGCPPMVKLGFETEFCKSGENTLDSVYGFVASRIRVRHNLMVDNVIVRISSRT